ncbi:hypothetical protein J6590_079634 [Homalodisca vitripennis]|nr:hypothetical protein J6590_079634 [Homalodisca vitripennis]
MSISPVCKWFAPDLHSANETDKPRNYVRTNELKMEISTALDTALSPLNIKYHKIKHFTEAPTVTNLPSESGPFCPSFYEHKAYFNLPFSLLLPVVHYTGESVETGGKT